MASEAKRATYHHGSLREALVDAADEIIRERGLEGFSLREATRRAGVSPGAPKHHFGSVEGLLSEVAAKAFEAQAVYMDEVPDTGDVPTDLRASVVAYVRFAIDNPGRYKLMLRKHLLQKSERLDAAAVRSLERMARLMAAYADVPITDETETIVAAPVMSSLALALGLAHMALDNALTPEDIVQSNPVLSGNTLHDIITSSWPDHR